VTTVNPMILHIVIYNRMRTVKIEASPFDMTFSSHFIKRWTAKECYPVNREIKSLLNSSSPIMDYYAPTWN
jgi:hypothetical protein